jgi:hypothetical protein
VVIVSEALDKFNVSPVLIVFEALRAEDHKKFPADDASQNEM